MKLNAIRSIDVSKGRYIVLCDYGSEGIHVEEQYEDLEEAIQDAMGRTGCCAIVQLAEVRELYSSDDR